MRPPLKSALTAVAMLAASLTLGAVLAAQTQPTTAPADRLIYLRPDGSYTELYPTDSRWPIVNGSIDGATVRRPGGSAGEWATTQPVAVPPSTPPVVVPPVVTPPVVMPPVVTPPVQPETPAESLPLLTRRIAPATGPRGDGVTLSKSNPTLRNAWIDGYRQNIVAIFTGPTPLTIENVYSFDAYRDPGEPYIGQCVYIETDGEIYIKGFVAQYAGWQPGKPAKDRSGYRHCIYRNFAPSGGTGKTMVVEDSWLDEAAACLLQSRGEFVLRRCLLTRGAIAICAVYGKGLVEDCTIYDGHHYFQPRDDNNPADRWTGDIAIMAYWPVVIRNTWIVGHPGQATSDVQPDLKTYNLGAIVCSGSYVKPEWRAPTTINPATRKPVPLKDLITTEGDCRIYGWPGPTYAGDRNVEAGKVADYAIDGWRVEPKAVDVWPQLSAIWSDLTAKPQRVSATAAVAKGQVVVRDAVR